ncbi:hypothetical protein CC86DRAFT_388737 [Ophiobolus disseminans]|uniref:Uncharacterized protein n=1 Tax=Ophiobolus disseminans TaxID=1469910 RepID=A0A6A6ZBV9_9PLEO|nr:hypothetical protein CC86DRAFT_388737 [Ophiobolus disseminans]
MLEPCRQGLSPELPAGIQCTRCWMKTGFGDGDIDGEAEAAMTEAQLERAYNLSMWAGHFQSAHLPLDRLTYPVVLTFENFPEVRRAPMKLRWFHRGTTHDWALAHHNFDTNTSAGQLESVKNTSVKSKRNKEAQPYVAENQPSMLARLRGVVKYNYHNFDKESFWQHQQHGLGKPTARPTSSLASHTRLRGSLANKKYLGDNRVEGVSDASTTLPALQMRMCQSLSSPPCRTGEDVALAQNAQSLGRMSDLNQLEAEINPSPTQSDEPTPSTPGGFPDNGKTWDRAVEHLSNATFGEPISAETVATPDAELVEKYEKTAATLKEFIDATIQGAAKWDEVRVGCAEVREAVVEIKPNLKRE